MIIKERKKRGTSLTIFTAAVAASCLLSLAAARASQNPATTVSATDAAASGTPPYRLGIGDIISVSAMHAEELESKPLTVGDDGAVTLPHFGHVDVGGRTIRETEEAIRARLSSYIRSPEVTVGIVEYGSRPVSVLGAVNKPGVYHLKGSQRLMEVLSIAGGARPDAGYQVTITRRAAEGSIPVASSTLRDDVYVAEINLTDIMVLKSPAANILVRSHDVISVPQARMVYVIGDVRKPGGFVLGERDHISVLQALSLSEGLLSTAGKGEAKILRKTSGAAAPEEIPIDVKKLLAGRERDVDLHPEDILFIPGSMSKKAALRVLDTALQIGTGVVIWRR